MPSGSARGPTRPAAGLTESLRAKFRSRRDRQQTLQELDRKPDTARNDLLPTLEIEVVPIESLKPANRRVRRRDAAQTKRLGASIAKFGICRPVLVGRDRRIIDGHDIWEEAKALGLDRVPITVVPHLTDSEQRLLSIALNRLAETGAWDVENLRLEVEELLVLGEDVLVTGHEPAVIDALLLDDNEEAPDDDLIPAIGEMAVSQLGDVWLLRGHRLIQGDARDAATYAVLIVQGEQVRLVLTDEPFNVANVGHVTKSSKHREFMMAAGEMSREEFADFNRAWMVLAAGNLSDGGLLATFIDWRSVEIVLATGRAVGLNLLNLIVWAKTNAGQGSLWRSGHELLPVFKKGSAAHVNNVALGRWGRWRSNVWSCPGASSIGSDARRGLSDHPTTKPRQLLEDAMLDVTNRGDIVLDPFVGSGSTLLAAETTGRICRAIEIDALYCDLTIRRWEMLTGIEATLAETGETFAAVKARRCNSDVEGE